MIRAIFLATVLISFLFSSDIAIVKNVSGDVVGECKDSIISVYE